MRRCQYAPYTLHFAFKALTSRGALPLKPTWFVRLHDDLDPDRVGYGEIALFQGLSAESTDDFESQVREACARFNRGEWDLSSDFIHSARAREISISKYIGKEVSKDISKGAMSTIPSSIRFGFESALMDLADRRDGYSSNAWISGREPNVINGLIWMGDFPTMLERIKAKLEQGFKCLKLKIGGIDFDSECELLRMIRQWFSAQTLVIRLDANGSFTPENAMERLQRLSQYQIHSIEQPIRQGQWSQMRKLCEHSPIDIALDEELIGIRSDEDKRQMLRQIRPQYIILKPSLCGGLAEARRWMQIAVEEFKIGVWYTSALETNVGLRAIAQTAFSEQVQYDMWMPQGLGTGEVFTNNIPSGIYRKGQYLWYDPTKDFDFENLDLNWIEP